MTSKRSASIKILACALLMASCAASGARTETVASQRLRDSAPERSAAMRAATPGLDLEAEDQRWGIEAAKARRRRGDPRQSAPAAPAPGQGASSVDVTAPNTSD